MASNFVTNLQITRKSLSMMQSYLDFAKHFDHRWESDFSIDGSPYGKIGQTINIRRPNQNTVRHTWNMQLQAINELSTPLTINTIAGVDIPFPESALSLVIDDFAPRYIDTAVMRMATDVDQTCGLFALNNTYNQVGTVGTLPATQQIFQDARTRLVKSIMPKLEKPTLIGNPETLAAAATTFATYFNPSAMIAKQYDTGIVSDALNMFWRESQIVSSHTNGTRAEADTWVVAKSAVTGAGQTTLTLTSSTNTHTWKQGDVFTVGASGAGIYAVNTETKQVYNYLQQFVVTADATAVGSGGGSAVTLSISPAITTSGAYQNVDVSTLANTSNAVKFETYTGGIGGSGLASQVYNNDLVFSEQAFAFAAAVLPDNSKFGIESKVANDNGFSIRYELGYDIVNSQKLARLDMYYGIAAVRPEWSTRIIGAHA